MAAIVASMIAGFSVQAQTLQQPKYTLVEAAKKVYGRASQDFRGIGVIDYWWVGHDPSDGPFKGIQGVRGRYSATQSFSLPTVAIDGTNMDRHACGFAHLNDDNKIDMICALGADKGKGSGPKEVYRNDSTPTAIRMTRIEGAMLPTGIEDPTGRGRAMTPFKFADGTRGMWSVVHGDIRSDGQPNLNRIFRYNGTGTFKFTEVASAPINVTTRSNCSVAGDLNGDGLDDFILCRTESAKDVPADSLLYVQSSDGSFRELALPMTSKRFVTAEAADLDGDGRSDLIASVFDERGPAIEIYLQTRQGTLPKKPSLRKPTSGQINSFAIGDLDGDGKPDIYAAISNAAECVEDAKDGPFTDRWPDIVLSTKGATSIPFVFTTMLNEPQADGCSWLATWAEPGIIHLGRGMEGTPADNYSLKFLGAGE
ncbi:MAG TPA: VCBS repeat-containing protein [Ideonella sp.]|nr:VCBS repeat-containing protein [Ideonella sp.]